jgi:hypothetical protein
MLIYHCLWVFFVFGGNLNKKDRLGDQGTIYRWLDYI